MKMMYSWFKHHRSLVIETPIIFYVFLRMNSAHFLHDVDSSWTLFIDRDGVINKRLIDTYVMNPSEFKILNGVLEAIYNFKHLFYKIVIVTNQQGIGKGLMTHDQLHRIHDFFLQQVKQAKGHIDEIYYCPDLKGIDSTRRKPAPGMGHDAQKDFPLINFNKSIMVGDMPSDMQFGKNLNMKTILVSENTNTNTNESNIDVRVRNLLEFSLLLQSYK